MMLKKELCLCFIVAVSGCKSDPRDWKAPREGWQPVRFAVVGDAGTGDTVQRAVGAQLATVCADQGCDLVLYLGDNFYERGISSPNDPLTQRAFIQPYKDVNAPFFAALGNHDYALFDDVKAAENQLAFSKMNEQFVMPEHSYQRVVQHVAFTALDTQSILLGDLLPTNLATDQAAAVDADWTTGPRYPWRIAFGHHPLMSNGFHGDAGAFDGLPDTAPMSGAALQTFLNDRICGRFDLYFAGHDHHREWLSETCNGTELAISGAGGADLRPRTGSHPADWSSDTEHGFIWVEITGDTLKAEFWNDRGEREYVLVRQRAPKNQP